MVTTLCQRLISLGAGLLLIGCSGDEIKADLITGFITTDRLRIAGATAATPSAISASTTASTATASPASAASPVSERPSPVRFSFHAFGDSGWAESHRSRPGYTAGFARAYARFDRDRSLLGDINYLNWETSVGRHCAAFWSRPSDSSYAFLTHPEELVDAIGLGFNLIGLANNHSFDCLRSPEGAGPRQTVAHLETIQRRLAAQHQTPQPLFSGVFAQPDQEPGRAALRIRSGATIPVTFLSAYVGGDPDHCRHIVCDAALESHQAGFAAQPGLRVLALHSWDPDSHTRLKMILRDWLQRGLIDVALGSGPHIAEEVQILTTPTGSGILATSLGNFIHPSLARQPYNIALLSDWQLDPSSGRVRLLQTRRTIVSCDGPSCRPGRSRTLWSSSRRRP